MVITSFCQDFEYKMFLCEYQQIHTYIIYYKKNCCYRNEWKSRKINVNSFLFNYNWYFPCALKLKNESFNHYNMWCSMFLRFTELDKNFPSRPSRTGNGFNLSQNPIFNAVSSILSTIECSYFYSYSWNILKLTIRMLQHWISKHASIRRRKFQNYFNFDILYSAHEL